MQTDKVYCVRIAQRVINTPEFKYFPYDRIYLARKQVLPRFSEMFRYYLHMEFTPMLFDALQKLPVNKMRELRVQRDDRLKEGVNAPHEALKKIVKDPRGWVMVVPTHVKTAGRKVNGVWKHDKSQLMYIVSRILQFKTDNTQALMPVVHLHTPQRDIPMLCAVCQKLPDMHAGNCKPGSGDCREIASVLLQLDSSTANTDEKAAEATGGDDGCRL